MSERTLSSVIREIIGEGKKRKSCLITNQPSNVSVSDIKKQRATLDGNGHILEVFGKVIIHMLQPSDVSSLALVCKEFSRVVGKEREFSTVIVKKKLESKEYSSYKELDFFFKNNNFLERSKELAKNVCEKTATIDERLTLSKGMVAQKLVENDAVIPDCCPKFCWIKELIRISHNSIVLYVVNLIEPEENRPSIEFYANQVMKCASVQESRVEIVRLANILRQVVVKQTAKTGDLATNTDYNGFVRMASACVYGNIEAAKPLLEDNYINGDIGNVFMWITCKCGHLNLVEEMVKCGHAPCPLEWYAILLEAYIKGRTDRNPQDLFDAFNRNLLLQAKFTLIEDKSLYTVTVDNLLVTTREISRD
jgi:hypothetical protein